MPPPRGPAAARSRLQIRAVVVGLFGVGLLCGFLLQGNSLQHTAHEHAQAAAIGSRQVQLGSQGSGVRADSPAAPQVLSVSAPPPLVAVGTNDIRHPKNLATLMRQQASGDDHGGNTIQSFIISHWSALTGRKSEDAERMAQQQLQAIQAGRQADHQQHKSDVKAAVAKAAAGATPVVLTGSTATGPGCVKAGAGCGLPGNTIHTLFTSNGSPYQNIQARIMIATWKTVRATSTGAHLVAMTRILHRTMPDELMDEVHTYRANPLQPECDKWCWFPVADRANAVQQWIDAVEVTPGLQKAPWLLLLETDYVWIKPLQVPGDAYDAKVPGLSFAYDYIRTQGNALVKRMLAEKCPTCDPEKVPNSGPAPVLARYEDFKAATPLWEELSLYIETHEDVKKGLGWVREMYAWCIGVAAGKCNILNVPTNQSTLISQPPHDVSPYQASMYHYTWGTEYKDASGKQVYLFDKRKYVAQEDAWKLPRIPLPPEWKEGWVLPDGLPITKQLHDTVVHMLTLMNAAIDTLPDLTQHAAQVAKQNVELEKKMTANAASAALKKITT